MAVLQKDVKLNKDTTGWWSPSSIWKSGYSNLFSSVLKKKKKNQTAFQTPECNPKEDNNAFNSVLNKTELSAQITNILKQNKKRCKHLQSLR